ncbi:hypothetical protein, partial [Xanthomonas vesicatoria]|uniref:hypothetical protein n=1 Tax=Xanthomonas vesicatoria TaxID=56460 RepID=UPI0019D13DAE
GYKTFQILHVQPKNGGRIFLQGIRRAAYWVTAVPGSYEEQQQRTFRHEPSARRHDHLAHNAAKGAGNCSRPAARGTRDACRECH